MLSSRVLRVVDGTDILEPGATGMDWRLHYSLRLPQLICDHFDLTDAHGAEQLARFAFAPDDVVLADRGYCHRAGQAKILTALLIEKLLCDSRSFSPCSRRLG